MAFKKEGHVNACKLCNHVMRDKVETAKICYGKSIYSLRDMIVAECPDDVMSTESIRRHFDRHVDEKREIQVRYLEEKRLNQATSALDVTPELNIKLVELRHLDKTICESSELCSAAALELKRQLAIKVPKYATLKDENGAPIEITDPKTGKTYAKQFAYDKVEVSHSVVQLFKSAAEEVRQASKAKREILGMDAKTKTADAMTTLADALISMDEEDS